MRDFFFKKSITSLQVQSQTRSCRHSEIACQPPIKLGRLNKIRFRRRD